MVLGGVPLETEAVCGNVATIYIICYNTNYETYLIGIIGDEFSIHTVFVALVLT